MNKLKRFYAIILLAGVNLSAGSAIAQKAATEPSPRASTTSVTGSGTPGQLVKWTGVSGQDTFTIGNSLITESKFGLIGIGTATPSSKLSVAGTIESLQGGFKFPDGTVQTTTALSSIFRDATLIGNGTAGSPLGIAPGGVGSKQLANGSVVRSFNGLFDNIQLVAGSNITITPSGNTLTIAAPNVLTSIVHDKTLTGNGTGESALGIAAGGVGTTQLADSAVTTLKLANGATTAPKLNTLTAPSAGQFLSFDGSSLVWQTLGGSGGVVTDSTLTGNGTSVSPLKVTVPLELVGASGSVMTIINSGTGNGLLVGAGNNSVGKGGEGLQVTGGVGNGDDGGDGLVTLGGGSNGSGGRSGDGILAVPGLAVNGASAGLAGSFLGDVGITGNLNVSGGTKNFKIDHPLDPENKYLYHAAIESAEVLNLYSGNITSDANGDAVVEMPRWFEAINKDFRYQLTVIGSFAQAIVGAKIKENRFSIKTSQPNVEVSWQVTGVRSDAVMLKHPFKLEEEKSAAERGHYLVPEAFDQPEEKSVDSARHPALMKQIKEKRQQITASQVGR